MEHAQQPDGVARPTRPRCSPWIGRLRGLVVVLLTVIFGTLSPGRANARAGEAGLCAECDEDAEGSSVARPMSRAQRRGGSAGGRAVVGVDDRLPASVIAPARPAPAPPRWLRPRRPPPPDDEHRFEV